MHHNNRIKYIKPIGVWILLFVKGIDMKTEIFQKGRRCCQVNSINDDISRLIKGRMVGE